MKWPIGCDRPRSAYTVLLASPGPLGDGPGFTPLVEQLQSRCPLDPYQFCDVTVVSSARYSRSSGAFGEAVRRGWGKSSLCVGCCDCVETIELRGEERLQEVAHDPWLQLRHMLPGIEVVRIRAVRILALVLLAGRVVAVIAWGCHSIARGVRLRAHQFALPLAGA